MGFSVRILNQAHSILNVPAHAVQTIGVSPGGIPDIKLIYY